MSQILSIELNDDQMVRLEEFARRIGIGLSEVGARIIEEAMREDEFGGVEFRDSVVGRLAYMRNSNLAVWEVIMIAQDHDMDAERVAAYFERPRDWVNAALRYYEAFRDDIDPMVEVNRSMTFEKLKRILPTLETLPAFEGAAE